jgi:DNA-binding response OmpR family regulator
MQGTKHSGLVLVIEDDASIRLLIREMLRGAHLQTVEAADGDSGVAAAIQHDPDAILLDIGLPDTDGFEVLRRLKATPALAAIPVIMVTAWTETEYMQRAVDAGAFGYVRKPFEMTEFLTRVESAVRARGRTNADPPLTLT